MAITFLHDGPERAERTILFAHGAGGAMDSAAMTAIAKALARRGFRVARFDFGYMAARRASGPRKPPPRAETLCADYVAAVDALGADRPIIGGKSMGGRVASLVADELFAAGRIAGLLCAGYPFHPIGKPDQLRTSHLARLRAPTLIAQGTRDRSARATKSRPTRCPIASSCFGSRTATTISCRGNGCPASRRPTTFPR